MATEHSREMVVVPFTGQAVELDSPAPDLAQFIDDVRDLEGQLRAAKLLVAQEMHRRMDRDRKWTVEEGGFKLTGESDADKWEWDAEHLIAVLDRLVDTDVISREAADAACKPEVTFKVQARGLNALLKNPRLKGLIEACGTVVPLEERRRRLSVSRVR